MNSEEKLFYSVKELQTKLGVGKNTALRLIKSDGFPKIRIGNKYYIPIDRFEKWIDDNINQTIGIKTDMKQED